MSNKNYDNDNLLLITNNDTRVKMYQELMLDNNYGGY